MISGSLPCCCAVGFDAVFDLLKQRVPRVDVGDVERPAAEDFLRAGFRLLRAHQSVYQRGMQVHHKGGGEGVVHGCFHAWPAVFGEAGGGEVVLHLLLALGCIGRIIFFGN